MIPSDFFNKIRFDPPFSYHRPHPHNKSVLIGAQAEELKILFEEIYSLSLINPIMTAIVGNPGTGKTHFLWNLEHRTNQYQRSGIVLIYELKDKTPKISDVIEFIHKHETFRKLAINNRIYISDNQEISLEQRAKEINNVIEKIRQEVDSNFGICLGVDVVDEFVRKLVITNNWNERRVILDLLGSFRLILDSINKICVIFALTRNVYDEMIPVVSGDQTLRRRFIIANGVDGEPIKFGALKEQEACNLVSTFMEHWAQRNDIDFNEFAKGNETWPFTRSAIKLAWRMTATPGGLSLICMDALFEKEKVSKSISLTYELSISELDIAISLRKNKSYPYLINDEKAWNEIEFLIDQNKIKDKISELKNQAEKDTKGQLGKEVIKDAFEKYLEDCGFKVDYGYSDVIVGANYAQFNKAVGIKFIDGLEMYISDVKTLLTDFHNAKVNAGLFIYIIDKKNSKSIKHHPSLAENFKNFDTRMDYTTTLLDWPMAKEDLLKVIGLRNLEKKERKILVEYLDKELGFKLNLESLMFTEPSIIPKEGK